jgi:hypothetical protein
MSSEPSSESRSEKHERVPQDPPLRSTLGEEIRIPKAPASPANDTSKNVGDHSKLMPAPKSARRDMSEIDDGTLSEVVRRPTRTAADLSEVADASPGITTEDLLAILKRSPSSEEFKPGASCSRTCSDG